MDTLNPMQRRAAMTTEGPLLILAGAGSGKTKVLTHRMARLVELGVDPFNILAITFTNKAAREMKERAAKLMPAGANILCCTFHSACVRILRREIDNLGYGRSFTIYDADDSERLIKTCIKELDINEKQFPIKTVSQEIGRQKDELISAADFESVAADEYRLRQISKIYSLYQQKLMTNNALDFDDIIFKTVELFISRPDILAKYQERYKYILVDEYQDTNTAQYHLVRLLASKYFNLCVVGDDDQSIYGWRGANIRNILDFEKDFKNVTSIKLEQNYRSTGNILSAANAVIKHNRSRKAKSLWTEHEDGGRIVFFSGRNDYDESGYIVKSIEKLAKKGVRRGDCAVLYRMNALSRTLEEQFVRAGVPYRVFGGVSFYQRREIKDILAYLKLISNPADSVAAARVINVPRRGIGDTTVKKINDYANENGMTFMNSIEDGDCLALLGARGKKCAEFAALIGELTEAAKTAPVVELLQTLLEITDITGDIKTNADNPDERMENVNELINKAADFSKNDANGGLAAFLEEVSLVADIDNYNESDDAVTLMTLHSAKGLEFTCVFIAGFEEGIFPSYRAIMSDNATAVEEERRLCYVGITRAKQYLYITSAKTRMQAGQTVYNAPSRFLKEIPLEYIMKSRESDF